MKLENPFPNEVRLLYLYEWECRLCHTNGGGALELHHIVGRVSCSVFNSCLLCTECHQEMAHSQKEEQDLFAKTFKWLHRIGYKPTEVDLMFIKGYYDRLFTDELREWLGAQRG